MSTATNAWFRSLARRSGLRNGVRAILRRLGFDLLRRGFFSPIPDLDALPPETWTQESELRGLRFDAAAGLEFVQRELGPYIAEYSPPRKPTGDPRDFFLDNEGPYGSVDAETLYAMVRRFKPSRIIELGSGYSTLVIADARERNGRLETTSHVVYDPYPRPNLVPVLGRVADLRTVSAKEVPFEDLAALQADDILFVDTSHAVKLGSEVNHVMLEMLPTLAPGVLVHVHDVFLPYEYPRMLPEEQHLFFAEQYLLQAFLAFNEAYEIVFSAHALQRKFPEAVSDLIRSARPETSPAAFWMRRTRREIR
jgi:hypothetical protein